MRNVEGIYVWGGEGDEQHSTGILPLNRLFSPGGSLWGKPPTYHPSGLAGRECSARNASKLKDTCEVQKWNQEPNWASLRSAELGEAAVLLQGLSGRIRGLSYY